MDLPAHLVALQQKLHPADALWELPTAGRRAAVLLLLYGDRGDVEFLLTERPSTLSRHAGQISLPGGMEEAEDTDLVQTALRETREELGVDPQILHILGRLSPLTMRVSDVLLVPFVAWTPRPPVVKPDPSEVAEVLRVPLNALLDPDAIREESWELRGSRWRVTFYRHGTHQIWGATAHILHDLATRMGATRVSGDPPGSVVPAPT